MIDKKWFCNYKESKNFIYNLIEPNLRPFDSDKEESSEIDAFVLSLLSVAVGEDSFVEINADDFFGTLPHIHKNQNITDLVKVRWKAVCGFFEGNKDRCIEALQEAHALAVSSDVPEWLTTDILIDLRNQAGAWTSERDVGNNAQVMLEASGGEVHFPLLDRFTSSAYAKMVNQYEKNETTNPHTISFGNEPIDNAIKNIFDAFLVAAFYGSITHLERVNVHLKKVLFAINLDYANNGYFKRYIKLCLLGWEGSKDENALTNAFQQRFALLSQEDAKEIWNLTNHPSFIQQKVNKKLIAMRYIGNLLDDDTFTKAANECLELVALNNILFWSSSSVNKFLKENAHRMDVNAVMKFLLGGESKNYGYICSVLINSVVNMDYSNITDESYMTIEKFIADESLSEHDVKQLLLFMIVMRRGIPVSYHERMDKTVRERHPAFYENEYLFEVCPNEKLQHKFIVEQLSEAERDNNTHGQRGWFRGDRSPLLTIRNVLSASKFNLNADILCNILSTALATLECHSQTLEAKIPAAELIVLLLQKHRSRTVEEYAGKLFENKAHITVAASPLENKSRALLDAHIAIIGVLVNKTNEKPLIILLASTNGIRHSEKIDFTAMIYRFSSRLSQGDVKAILLQALFQYSYANSYDKSDAIRHYAVRTLTNLARLLPEFANEVLNRFSETFAFETGSNKSYIIDGALKISKNAIQTIEIFNKAKQDANFHMRKLAIKLLDGTLE
jgi:hypothetical protein